MIDDLWNVTISKNTPGSVNAIVELKIETQDHLPVVTVNTSPFNLNQGINYMSAIHASVKFTTNYGTNPFSATLRQTGTLPAGNYIFCASISSSADPSLQNISCEERELSGSSKPHLIAPYDQEEIDDVHPMLTWSPPFPVDESKLSYTLLLTSINEHQSPEQAIKNNVLFINRSGITSKFWNYSSDYTSLEEGKSYAWKVDVFYSHLFIGSTEVWVFRVHHPATITAVSSAGTYNLINDLPADGYYIADDILRIGYDNRANDRELNYRIIQTDTRKLVDFNQHIPLLHGINQIDFDLSRANLKNGIPYELKIEDRDHHQYSVVFYFTR